MDHETYCHLTLKHLDEQRKAHLTEVNHMKMLIAHLEKQSDGHLLVMETLCYELRELTKDRPEALNATTLKMQQAAEENRDKLVEYLSGKDSGRYLSNAYEKAAFILRGGVDKNGNE